MNIFDNLANGGFDKKNYQRQKNGFEIQPITCTLIFFLNKLLIMKQKMR